MFKRLAVLALLASCSPALADDMSEALKFCSRLDYMTSSSTCTKRVTSGEMPAASLLACWKAMQMALVDPNPVWSVKRFNEFNAARNLCDSGFNAVSGYNRFVQGSQQ